jgi:hypothetical protein
MKSKVINIVLILAVVLLGLWAYHGGWKSLTIAEQEIGPFQMIYEPHEGDYEQLEASIDKLKQIFRDKNIEPLATYRIYYDDPAQPAKTDSKSEAGLIFRPMDLEQLKDLFSTYRYKEYGKKRAVITEFPYRSPLSQWLLQVKVYPALERYMREKGLTKTYVLRIDSPVNGTSFILPEP